MRPSAHCCADGKLQTVKHKTRLPRSAAVCSTRSGANGSPLCSRLRPGTQSSTSIAARLAMSSNISAPPVAASAAVCAACHSSAVSPCHRQRDGFFAYAAAGSANAAKCTACRSRSAHYCISGTQCSEHTTLVRMLVLVKVTAFGPKISCKIRDKSLLCCALLSASAMPPTHLLANDAAGRGRHTQVPRQLVRKLLTLRVQPCRQKLHHQQPFQFLLPLCCFLLPTARAPP